MVETFQPNPAEHIDVAELQRRYEEKKRLLEAAGAKTETKQIFREAFREQVTERSAPASAPLMPPAPAPVLPTVIPPATPGVPSSDNANAELKTLVSTALEKGVLHAIKQAQAETPYLIDALHDELADHYYEKLVQSGQLNAD